MIKMIGLDLDDTFLRKNGEISPRNKEAVRMAMERGIKVVVATGRSWRGASPYVREIGVREPVICYCGAKVVYPDGTLIEEKKISDEVTRCLIDFSRENNICLGLFVDDYTYVERVTDEAAEIFKIYAFTRVIPNLDEILTSAPTQIMAMGERSAEALMDFLKRSSMDAMVKVLRFDAGTPRSRLNLLPPGVDKANSLRAMAERYGIDRNEIMAFGDSVADLGMIEYAGIGVAMGWAPPEVKKVADVVTAPDDPDAVASVMAALVFGSTSCGNAAFFRETR